jgi:hypothetical protein
VKAYVIDVNTSHTPEEGAHSPSWPNGLIFIIRHANVQGTFRAHSGNVQLNISSIIIILFIILAATPYIPYNRAHQEKEAPKF